VTDEQDIQADALLTEWRAALATKLEQDDTDEWEAADRWEQEAYDRLINFIEANELNDSDYDPRRELDS